MQTIAGFPFFEVQFNKEGSVHDDHEVNELSDTIATGRVTDLFVMSHGWNNNMEDARHLYQSFFNTVRAGINANRLPQIAKRSFAVLGILWPSIEFENAALIPGGAASMGELTASGETLREEMHRLKGIFDHPEADSRLERAAELLPLAKADEATAAKLVDLIRSLPHKEDIHPDDMSDQFFKVPGTELVNILSRPDLPKPAESGQGGAASFDVSVSFAASGGAAGFDFFGGVESALRKALNFTTYFQMKERAGTVGRTGVYSILTRLRDRSPGLKIHLIGHSFGGRLVTSAANGPDGKKPIRPQSLTLLQAAFSHNGFAQRFDGHRDGFFRKVIAERKVAGPIIITHSIRDVAVGMTYPIASKLSGSDSATFGGRNDRFGGIGRNGAQFTPEALDSMPLGPVTSSYNFEEGKIYNLNADVIILEHSDIVKPEIAHALLSAVAAT